MENPILKPGRRGDGSDRKPSARPRPPAGVQRDPAGTGRCRLGGASSASVAGWMSALWENFQFKVENPRLLLEPWQERVLWQRAILESEESSSLLQVGGAAATAQEAWALAVEWRLNISLVESDGNEDSRVFGIWARRFQNWCDDDRLIEGVRLPDYLRGAMARLPLPTRVILVGFDELTPQQRDFVEACRAAGCAIETVARRAGNQAESTVRACFADPSREIEAAARWRAHFFRANRMCGLEWWFRTCQGVVARWRGRFEMFWSLPLNCPATVNCPDCSMFLQVSRFDAAARDECPFTLRPLPQRNEWDKVSGLVLNPYVAGAVTERAGRGLLDARMRRAGEMRVSMAALRRLCARMVPLVLG